MPDVSLFVNDGKLRSALIDREATLRKAYIAAEEGTEESLASSEAPSRSHEDILQDSAAFLELLVVVATWFEAAEQLGLRTTGEFIVSGQRLAELAQAISGYDSVAVATDNVHRLPRPRPARAPDPGTPLNRQPFLKYCEGAIASCPIEQVERLATQIERPALGHRCRKAYDALVAAARRASLDDEHAGRVLGRAYHERRLSLAEVAEAMCVSVPDALAFLDAHGFARSLDLNRLDDDQRQKTLEAMRRDRLARNGSPPEGAGPLAVRNVIASQRIEDVDARRWLTPR